MRASNLFAAFAVAIPASILSPSIEPENSAPTSVISSKMERVLSFLHNPSSKIHLISKALADSRKKKKTKKYNKKSKGSGVHLGCDKAVKTFHKWSRAYQEKAAKKKGEKRHYAIYYTLNTFGDVTVCGYNEWRETPRRSIQAAKKNAKDWCMKFNSKGISPHVVERPCTHYKVTKELPRSFF